MPFNTKLGVWVSRAIVALPGAAGQNDLFVIAGGAVLVTAILGRVTTVFGAGAANANLIHDAVPNDICAATAAENTAADTRLWITGNALDYLQFLDPAANNVVSGVCPDVFAGLVMLDGTIQLNLSANMAGGATAWELFYIPIEAGATVVST